uniref:Uncharacterized protein n=1 Tax=Aegilops tauschii subsp. strangulata TaxID=200361 RepID=A0A453IZU7_AEGTS
MGASSSPPLTPGPAHVRPAGPGRAHSVIQSGVRARSAHHVGHKISDSLCHGGGISYQYQLHACALLQLEAWSVPWAGHGPWART